MTSLTLDASAPVYNWTTLRSHASAAVIAVALHAGLAWVLVGLSDDQPAVLETPAAPTMLKTQLVQLQPPAPIVPPAVEPAPPVPAPREPVPVPEPIPEPVVERPQLEQADLAHKRAEQLREEEAQRKRQQEQAERKRQRDEDLALERQRQEEQLAQQRETQQREAQAQQRAEADRQAAAATARAQAEAEAASRQYLPIAKDAPAYPQRALDRNIEGECTVSYTVSPTGRVEKPQVLDDCHPLFKSPSLAAAKRFRYQPRVVNGQAVAVQDVKNTFSYRIE